MLEQCPNTCNVFVPRIRMRAHLKECPRNKRRSASLERVDQQVDHRVQVVENEINTLRSVLNEEIRQRLHLIDLQYIIKSGYESPCYIGTEV